MTKKLGFTLTELIIALVILVILALVAIPVYRGYVRKGIATEGKALLGEINAAQQIYYSRHGKYYSGTSGQQIGASFGVDARRNKYFTTYHITTSGDTFNAITDSAKGHHLTLKGYATTTPEIIDGSTVEDPT
ncbi:MAG: type IV pilin protein [Endomicrobiaceae bacterium]|nr:type IV pilin protein [Endomicrobiaceae bacterium]